MESPFKTGQKVESLANAQGLLKGHHYVVVGVSRRRTFVGTFTTLLVQANGEQALSVGNPHLVLKEVA